METVKALVVLNPYESRRLIAKAVRKLPVVENALNNGWVIIATGSSTGYVAEEITGNSMAKESFITGHIADGQTRGTKDDPNKLYPISLYKGQRQDIFPEEAIKEFKAEDVFIKGANAVDANFHAGVFLGNDLGGTIGWSLGTLQARGAKMVVPVGLEKMIPSVLDAAKHGGMMVFKHRMGMPVALMPIVNPTVVTEIQAFGNLFNVQAYHVGSGGIAGSEGAVVLVLEGEAKNVEKAFEFAESVKGEKPLPLPPGTPITSKY